MIAAMSGYRIVVRGELGGAVAQAFEGMRVEAGSGQTVLTGDIVDQAQLHGVLQRLSQFGIELVSLTSAAPEQTTEEPSGKPAHEPG